MIHFLPEKVNKNKSWGEAFGEALQGLTQSRLQGMQARQDANSKAAFWTQAGLDPKFAHALASQPEAIQKSFLDRLEGLNVPMGQQMQQQYQPQQQLQEPTYQQQSPIQQPRQQSPIDFKALQQPRVEDVLRTLQFGQQSQQLKEPEFNQQQEQQVPQFPLQLPSEAPIVRRNNQQTQPVQQQPLVSNELRLGGTSAQRYQQEKIEQAERHHEENLELKKEENKLKHQEQIDKRFDPLIKEYAKSYQTNKELIPVIDDFIETSKEAAKNGELPSALEESILTDLAERGIGGHRIDLRSLRGASAEKLRKLSAQMINIASAGIPGVKTNLRVTNLAKATPSLMQSPEGQVLVAESMKILAESNNVPFEETLKILEENDGNIPKNFNTEVIRRSTPKQQEILSKLRSNYDITPQTIDTPSGTMNVLGKVDELPPASQSKNERYFDPEKNQEVISNGKTYVKYTGQRF